MTSEGEATVGWFEARTEAGRLQVIVSGAEISYAASCGSVSVTVLALCRYTSVYSSAGRTTAFQPYGSDCAETIPASSSSVAAMPVGMPRVFSHESTLRTRPMLGG